MAINDSDACIPQIVTDFVFDLSDSVITSHIAEEQSKLYQETFRELSSKYFGSSPWPSPQSIASECNGDPQFLALYREVTHRHFHSVSRPSLRDRIEGWHVYRELFDELLDDASAASTKSPPSFYILPGWTFDILHEFVYQFQGFCQFRAAVRASAKKHGLDEETAASSSSAPHHLVEHLSVLAQHKDAWSTELVLDYLHRFIQVGKTATAPAYQHLGVFSCVALSRCECLLGDYRGCLEALEPISSIGEGEALLHGVFAARLSAAYHAGVAYLMTRRYKDATRTLADICDYMQRGFKTGQLRQLPGADQFNKLYDRMLSLLAIVTHIAPVSGLVEDRLMRTLLEKHGSTLAKIDAGEDTYETLFTSSCPKFISPNNSNKEDAYQKQVKHFVKEMASQQKARKLRSYLKLYTSIPASKLASFNDMEDDQFIPVLLSYKLKMRQLEKSSSGEVVVGSALDIHYYLDGTNMVHVDEAEKQRRFENYFLSQIAQAGDIIQEVEAISTTV